LNPKGAIMAKKPKNTPAPAINLPKLTEIVTATVNNSFVYTSAAENAPLIAAGLAEINDTIKDANGNVATRATEAGKAYVANPPGTGAASGTTTGGDAPKASAFAIVKGAALPPIKRGVSGETIYPFDTMEVNDSFFVPVSADHPNPAKSLASTVSSATARYAQPVTNPDGSAKMVAVMRLPRDPATGKAMKGQPKVSVNVQETKETRKFVVRSVKSGVGYGAFTAPADGALVQRIA
jgi:hypothetical protein